MNIKISEIAKYNFLKCSIEPAVQGYSVFDAKNRYIGKITEFGFGLNYQHEHAKQLAVRLSENKIPFWDDELHRELQLPKTDDPLLMQSHKEQRKLDTTTADEATPDPELMDYAKATETLYGDQ